MCLILVCKTKRPADDILLRADDRNDDGIGLAWREKGRVKWEKGLDVEQLIEHLNKTPPAYPYVIHFRSATSGGEIKELCHPFVASGAATTSLKGSAKEVLFHNGHWLGWDYKLRENLFRLGRRIPPGPWSDSRAFAWFVGIYGKEVLDWLELKGEQRICLFSYKDIQLIGSWSESDGFLHSNPTHQWMGPINITPKKDFEKEKKLSKKERKALLKEGSKSTTQMVLSAAKDCTLGKPVSHRFQPSWQTDKRDIGFNPNLLIEGEYEEEDEKKKIPTWSGSTKEDDAGELPIIAIKPERYWEVNEIWEILCEIRKFNWQTFSVARPRQPLRTL